MSARRIPLPSAISEVVVHVSAVRVGLSVYHSRITIHDRLLHCALISLECVRTGAHMPLHMLRAYRGSATSSP